MPFSPSDYSNIPSSGDLPGDMVPADQISFAYSFTYEKDFDPRDGLQSTLNGIIVLELKDSGGNLKATFELRETFRIVLLPLAPSLVFYIWNWDANKEKFTGTDANGEPIDTLGEVSLGVIPSGDSSSSDRTAYVSAKFYSYIFNIDVEEGDVLKIKSHTLSAGSVVARASLQVATRLGGEASPAIVDKQHGQQFRANSAKKQTRMIRSRRLDSPLSLAQTEWTQGDDGLIFAKPLKGANIAQTEGGSLYVLGTSDNQLLLLRSQDAGKTWKQIMSESTDIKILAARLAFGGRYIIYGVNAQKKPSYVILKHGQDKWIISESGPCTLTADSPSTSTPTPSPPTEPAALPTSRVNGLENGDGGALRLLATDKDGTLFIWLSRDGKEWKQSTTAK